MKRADNMYSNVKVISIWPCESILLWVTFMSQITIYALKYFTSFPFNESEVTQRNFLK